MAESKHDDLADALARLAEGDVAPSTHLPPAPVPPVSPATTPPAGAKKIARPATVRPAVARPAGPATVPPVATPKPPAVVPAPGPAPVGSTPPTIARPARPVAPGSLPQPTRPVAPAAQVIRRQRPSAPTLGSSTIAPTDSEVDGGQSTGLSAQFETAEVVDDDDSVIAPAPDASAFIPRKNPSSTAEARAAIRRKKNLEYRRTLIPILLTSGILLLGFGLLKFVVGADSTLKYIPDWIPLALIGAAMILIAIAGVNMMSVKQQLAAREKA